jgi:uncharacterized protein
MLYLDTSLLVSANTNEPESQHVLSWLEAVADQQMAISFWTEPEYASALGIKVRNNSLDPKSKAIAQKIFRNQVETVFRMLPVRRTDFARAAEMVTAVDRLRPPDALHLAVAAAHDAILCTLDRDQAEAGSRLGHATNLI